MKKSKKNFEFLILNFKLLIIVLVIAAFAGCQSTPKEAMILPEKPDTSKVILAPGDEIEVKFAYSAEFNEIQFIRPDGKIALQFVGEIKAAGKTPSELREELKGLRSFDEYFT